MSETGMQGQVVFEGKVLPEWIDVNNHMNVAWYVLAFDQGVDSLWDRFGITNKYIETTENSTFAVEAHINYLQELCLDDPITVTSQVLAYDEKRIHQYMRMYHSNHAYVAATIEWMNLHIDLESRRVCPWPEPILEGIRSFVSMQGDIPLPGDRGHRISVKKAMWQVEGYRA